MTATRLDSYYDEFDHNYETPDEVHRIAIHPSSSPDIDSLREMATNDQGDKQ